MHFLHYKKVQKLEIFDGKGLEMLNAYGKNSNL